MATWATLKADQERRDRRAAHDAVLRERHTAFDLSAQDNHMRYERAHFAIVGEGSARSQDNFRRGYVRIDWSRA